MTYCSIFGIRTRVGVKLFPIWHGVRILMTARKFLIVFYGKGGVEKWFPHSRTVRKKGPLLLIGCNDYNLLLSYLLQPPPPPPSTCKMICIEIEFFKSCLDTLNTSLDDTSTLQGIPHRPWFIVFIYLHYNYDVRIATFFKHDLLYGRINEAINVHKWWNPYIFQSLFVINTLEHAG